MKQIYKPIFYKISDVSLRWDISGYYLNMQDTIPVITQYALDNNMSLINLDPNQMTLYPKYKTVDGDYIFTVSISHLMEKE